MSNAAELHASSIEPASPELHEAEVLDSASSDADLVRCLIGSLGDRLATDPCSFNPVSRKSGWFYPKKGDRAIVAQHLDGPDTIIEWWPAAGADPDDT